MHSKLLTEYDACSWRQVDVVQALTQILPTGGLPASIIEKDIKAGEAILQIISGVLIPTSEVHCLMYCRHLDVSVLLTLVCICSALSPSCCYVQLILAMLSVVRCLERSFIPVTLPIADLKPQAQDLVTSFLSDHAPPAYILKVCILCFISNPSLSETHECVYMVKPPGSQLVQSVTAACQHTIAKVKTTDSA